jgi:hypothetical protein
MPCEVKKKDNGHDRDAKRSWKAHRWEVRGLRRDFWVGRASGLDVAAVGLGGVQVRL